MRTTSPANTEETAEGPIRAGRLSFAVYALARTHRAFAAQLLRDLGLYPGQEQLLMQLLGRDGQTQSELLAAVGLDHSTVSKSLKRMQEAGLLRREQAEHDRRAMQVWLTDKGRAMRRPLEEMWSKVEQASVRDLDEESIEQFIAISEAMRKTIIEQHAADHAAGPFPPGL